MLRKYITIIEQALMSDKIYTIGEPSLYDEMLADGKPHFKLGPHQPPRGEYYDGGIAFPTAQAASAYAAQHADYKGYAVYALDGQWGRDTLDGEDFARINKNVRIIGRVKNIVEAAEQQLYLRLGDLPQGGRSKIGRAPNWLKARYQTDTHEAGVSVYPVEWDEGRQRWSIDCGNMASLDGLFQQKRPAYLVSGDLIPDEEAFGATGMDGEPLIQNARIVKQVEYKDLYVPGWGNDPLPEEYLDLD